MRQGTWLCPCLSVLVCLFFSASPAGEWHGIDVPGMATPVNISADSSGNSLAVLAHDENYAGQLFVTGNGGRSWVDRTAGLPGGLYLGPVCLDPRTPSILYLGCRWEPFLYKSTDGGASWVASGVGLVSEVRDISLHAWSSDTFLVRCDSHHPVYRTCNGGATWDSSWTGMGIYWILCPLARTSYDPYFVLAAGSPCDFTDGPYNLAVFRSFDGGATWERCMNGLPDGILILGSVAADPVRRGVLYISISDRDHQLPIYRSLDAGDYWTEMPSTLGLPRARWLSASSSNPAEMFLLSDADSFYRSGDTGLTWQSDNDGLPPDVVFHDLALVRGTPLQIIAATDHGLWSYPDTIAFGIQERPVEHDVPATVRVRALGAGCLIEYALPRASAVLVELRDIVGRRVRLLENGRQSAGQQRLVWDGRDDSGRRTPAGVYLVRVLSADGVSAGRFVKLR